MNQYIVTSDQNGGEYYGHMLIKCNSLGIEKVKYNIISVDDVEIELNGLIKEITLLPNDKIHTVQDYYSLADDVGTLIYTVYTNKIATITQIDLSLIVDDKGTL